MKVFINPPNSLIMSRLVEKLGHEPLTMMERVGKKVRDNEIDSPPMNITEIDAEKGLKYASSEVPSGVRGRMAIIGPMIDEADAAIIVSESNMAFGCVGCARSNELINYLLINRDIPLLKVRYPNTDEEGQEMIQKVKQFLEDLE
ncbi:methanogenesis marker 5 protein [Methanonatronarchaeum sp. AMET-Sl]|uniref:methanogenesis marker 5 protein n=1 Tax=Methanonatronarchaeum sp. AMET-Sl TaxID=3037654 RepID=UPI00244E544C|nr:methanogenesis marker 5 protein [Methanonatronarchaeum sp. AMET-Sl]WGI17712.1 methanogenesis marker 5 protein [Methanonatronarchaeum sp. AMET-Sl]